MNKTGVGFMHPDLCEMHEVIELTEDVVEGDVRDEEYVQKFSGMTNADFARYLNRAAFYNCTERTLQAVTGALVRKDFIITGPGINIDEAYSLEDGLIGIYQSLLTTGRTGLLLDPTPTDSRRVVLYDSDDIINWSDTYVVLDACRLVKDPNDEFVQMEEDRRLVLKLIDGVYTAQYFTKQDTPNAKYEPSSELITPLFRGKALDFIPFIAFNPHDITFTPAKPPLNTLAQLNLQHFNTSLMIAYGSRFFALPKPWISGTLSGVNADGTAPSTVTVGTEDVLLLNPGASVGYLEFNGQGGMAFLASERDKLEEQMAALGSRLLTEHKGVESVEALNLRLSTEAASLMAIVKTTEAALNTVLQWCQDYVDGQVSEIALNKDLAPLNLTPQQVSALLQAFTANVITAEQVIAKMYAAEFVEPTQINA